MASHRPSRPDQARRGWYPHHAHQRPLLNLKPADAAENSAAPFPCPRTSHARPGALVPVVAAHAAALLA
jgi:hypothetical protein